MCNVVQLCLAANNILLMCIKMKLHFSSSCNCPCMKVAEHFTFHGYSLKNKLSDPMIKQLLLNSVTAK